MISTRDNSNSHCKSRLITSKQASKIFLIVTINTTTTAHKLLEASYSTNRDTQEKQNLIRQSPNDLKFCT